MALPKELTAKNQLFMVTRYQTTDQIAAMIKKAIEQSKPAADYLAPNFGGTQLNQCKQLYFFAKSLVPYKREPGGNQTAKTLQRIIQDANKTGGDCKHYTTVICSIAKSLQIPIKMRLISQRINSKSPTHIYAVAIVDGKEIVIDPCMQKFMQQARYFYKKDVQP